MVTETVSKRLLIIDDEENMRHMLCALLRKFDYFIDTASDGYEGLKLFEKEPYDFVLCDIKMSGMDGMDFLRSVGKEKLSGATVIMMSAYGSIDMAIGAMKLGAYDYISKPFKSDEVYLALKKAEEREGLKKENLRLKKRIKKIKGNYSFGGMVGQSSPMQELYKIAGKAADYNTTVLITGESGTGKELVARGIHSHGERENKPIVSVNCGGIPDSLMESELFGYKKGAFTGADHNKKGLFEEADKGTIFLDEIGELPLSLQVKLLRVLQEKKIRPVGDSKEHEIDVRVIAATAKNLEDEVKKGRFREDLFYRINVLRIRIPPLRDCIEDIPVLSRHFIDLSNIKYDQQIRGVSKEALSLLLKYHWPGNVRELENIIERAVVLAEQDILEVDDFQSKWMKGYNDDRIENRIKGYSLKKARIIMEKGMITKALKATEGNRTRAARILEISHPSLLSKIKAYNILL
ncbi:MAG: hypothetical protein B6I22_08845 [Desulfobacteraceae bacterium 4572_123]|nr:MAG: hypothetical protein B6I22_08845 [Desulfobacteraceae bacterium 4572_123]